jgi:hypothetical protein
MNASPAATQGADHTSAALPDTSWHRRVSQCRTLFNSSAATDSDHRSDWQLFESQPLQTLKTLLLQDNLTVQSAANSGGSPRDSSFMASSSDSTAALSEAQRQLQCAKTFTHVVLFSHLLPQVADWLSVRGFSQTGTFPHADFAVDREHEAAVVLFARALPKTPARKT